MKEVRYTLNKREAIFQKVLLKITNKMAKNGVDKMSKIDTIIVFFTAIVLGVNLRNYCQKVIELNAWVEGLTELKNMV